METYKKNFTVYFEMFGRKMKTTVLAENEQQAKSQVFLKIKFHSVQETKDDTFNDIMDALGNLHDFLKK